MKTLSLALILFVTSLTTFAQKGETKIDRSGKLTWLGINYTLLSFDGDATQFKDAGEMSANDMRNKYFPAWNALVANEPKNYDLRAATGFEDLEDKSELSEKLNSAGKKEYFNGKGDNTSQNDIESAIRKYNFKGLSGTGLVFFVTYMNKTIPVENMWVAYVSLPSGNVLQVKQYDEKPGGFGFRNYWMKGVNKVMKAIEKEKR